jgi:hypothetical protein
MSDDYNNNKFDLLNKTGDNRYEANFYPVLEVQEPAAKQP